MNKRGKEGIVSMYVSAWSGMPGESSCMFVHALSVD